MSSTNTSRIAKNTLMLYIRMIFLMLVALYTSRVILNALGVIDYGIYMAVGGFVAMFGVLSNSLTAAISRFITFELGRQDEERTKKVFSAALYIQFAIAAIVLIFLETFGLWFLNAKMTIPAERVVAANWVFQFSILTFVINLISIPYNASIIAHEHMKAFACIGIIQALASLGIAFLIQWLSTDKLLLYALLMALVAILVRILYGWYCNRNFSECRFSRKCDKEILKQIFGFAGWNFIGASSGVLRDQGINVLINIFCGPAINAARGIAVQVSSAVTQFSSNFLTAVNPQITKSYATGDRAYLMQLIFQGARFSVYLLLLLSFPILLETQTVLTLWLKIVPDYAVVFVRLILIYIIVEAISYTMTTLMLATGDIRNYQILVGGCQMLNFPVAYMLLKWDYSPESTIVASILIANLCMVLRLYMLRRLVDFPVRDFVHKVLMNIVVVAGIAVIFPIVVVQSVDIGFPRLLLTCLVSLVSTGISIYYIGCSSRERYFLNEKILVKLKQYFT